MEQRPSRQAQHVDERASWDRSTAPRLAQHGTHDGTQQHERERHDEAHVDALPAPVELHLLRGGGTATR